MDSPLVEVAMAFVRVAAPHFDDEALLESIRDSFASFLSNDLPREHLAAILEQHVGSTQPLERIETILQVPADPPPHVASAPDSNPGLRKKPRPWCVNEDNRLFAGIHWFGLENWGHVAKFVGPNRTRAQCAQRWVRGLDPRISKDQWSSEDEVKLITLMREKGCRIWTAIAAGMGNRSDVQCRYHFFQMQRDGRVPLDLVRADRPHGARSPSDFEAMPALRVRTGSPGRCPPLPAHAIRPGRIPAVPPSIRQLLDPAVVRQRRSSLPNQGNLPIEGGQYARTTDHDSDGEVQKLAGGLAPGRRSGLQTPSSSDLIDWSQEDDGDDDDSASGGGWW
jgi:hypothetical protein